MPGRVQLDGLLLGGPVEIGLDVLKHEASLEGLVHVGEETRVNAQAQPG